MPSYLRQRSIKPQQNTDKHANIPHIRLNTLLISKLIKPIGDHTLWNIKNEVVLEDLLTETGPFGGGTGTSGTQISSTVHKFQLQVGPEERERERQTQDFLSSSTHMTSACM